MKILLPEVADDKEARQELFNDAEVGIKMRHPNVINILKVNRTGTPYFIMEFFPSGSLRTRLMSKDPSIKQFLKDKAKTIFKQAATGLAYMNASGFVHCDVKPDNILANALGQTKIIDFAITKRINTGLFGRLFGGKKLIQGSASFMAPEQILGERLDGRADIYSFGVTMYEMVTGRPPFRAASKNELYAKHIREKPITPVAYNPDVTDEFAALVLKTLAKKRDDRPKTFHEVLMELQRIKVFKSVVETEDEPN
jgi:serine/threonine protein kinase